MAELLVAYPGAAKEKDRVRTPRAHHNPLRCVAPLSLRSSHAAQRGRLPLHYAAAGKASKAVVGKLLDAYPGAAKEKDGVRRPRPQRPLRCVAALAYIRALTCSPPLCAGWEPPAALC
jgi:hypothetical protein